MLSQLQCQLCTNEFNADNLPRLLTSCGHTFCESCIDTLMSEIGNGQYKISCPQDSIELKLKTNDISQFPKNIALLKVIEAKKNNSSTSFKDQSLQITKIPRKEDSHGNESQQEIINQIDCNEPQNINSQPPVQQQSIQSKPEAILSPSTSCTQVEDSHSICFVHQKPMDIVCLVDLEKICAKCAIFGQHKGHEFKSIQNIEQECNTHKQEILKIYNQKEMIQKRIENQDNKKEIMGLLIQQKNKIQKEIADRYKKIIDKIKKAEELNYKKLDEISTKIQNKINSIIKIDQNTEKQYVEWQRDSFGKILKLQESAFDQKMQILYGNNNIETVIERGEQIVSKMQQKQENVINEVQGVIDSISLQFNDQIFNHVDGFIKLIEVQKLIGEWPQKNQDNVETEMPINYKQRSPSAAEDYLLEPESHEHKVEEVPSAKIMITPFVPKIEMKVEQKIQKTAVNTSKEKVSYEDLQFSQIVVEKLERPPKKKLKSIKVPQKIQKTLDLLYNDAIQLLDLTNTQLGDSVILQICEFLRGTRVRTVKFIRCKLTDQAVSKMIYALGNISTLYLSQNMLTENAIETLINNRQSLPSLRSVILSQNRIIERKHKTFIDRLKKLDIAVSV